MTEQWANISIKSEKKVLDQEQRERWRRVGPTNNGDLRKEEDGQDGHVGHVCQEGYHVTSVTQLAGVARLAEYLSVPAWRYIIDTTGDSTLPNSNKLNGPKPHSLLKLIS